MSRYIEIVLPSALQISEHDLISLPRSLLHLSRHDAIDQANRDILSIPEDALPPLDVAMLWHAYMLNPGRYAEDAAGVDVRHILYFILYFIHSPLLAVASRIRNSLQEGAFIDDTDKMATRWSNMTGLIREAY